MFKTAQDQVQGPSAFLAGLSRFFRTPVFILSVNAPFGGARLQITQHAFQFDQCLGIGRALRVQQGVEILDGNGLPARSMLDIQLRFPVKINHSNL